MKPSKYDYVYKDLQEQNPDCLFMEDAAEYVSKQIGRPISCKYLQTVCVPSQLNLGEIKTHSSGLFRKMLCWADIALAIEHLQRMEPPGKWKRKSKEEKTKAFCSREKNECVTAGSVFPPAHVQLAKGCLDGLRQMPKFSAAEAAKELGQDIADIQEILHDEITQGRLRDVGNNAYGHKVYRWQLVDQVEASLGRIKSSMSEQIEREFYPLAQQVRSAREQVKNADELLIQASLENERLKEELSYAKKNFDSLKSAADDAQDKIASQEELIVALNSEKLRMQEEVAIAQNQERWANSSFLTAEAALRKAKDKVKELQTQLSGYVPCVDCEVANR